MRGFLDKVCRVKFTICGEDGGTRVETGNKVKVVFYLGKSSH